LTHIVDIEGALDRMPHKGAMRLIESISSVSEQDIHCIATLHVDATYPLRIDGTLFSTSLVELGAQAAAAHASLFGVSGNHTGLLIGLQNIEVHKPTVTECHHPMDVTAQQLHFDTNGSLYSFKVISGDEVLVTGRAALKMQGEPE
jgi:predicted hotdog family 3-hydroxylacyl-ACP dehydratase